MLNKVLASPKSPWAEGSGPDVDVVLCSRMRLARNFAPYPFPERQNRESALQVWKVASDLADATPDLQFYDLAQTDPLDRQVLVEKHLISPQQAIVAEQYRALVLQDELNCAIMVNEEDHVRLQYFAPGFDLDDLWLRADQLDNRLGSYGEYAFDPRWGYLTACPSNIGTGLRASVLLHLPALQQTGRLNILQGLPAMGMAVRGLFGEGSKAHGHFYQVSNQQTLGYTETEIIQNLKSVTERLVGEERRARMRLAQESTDFDDQVWRAWGLLTHARRMSSTEAFGLLSIVRVGITQERMNAATLAQLDPLFVTAQAGMLQYRAGGIVEEDERDRQRAEVIRETIHGFKDQN